MGARAEILLLIAAFAEFAALPVLIPWVVVRMVVDLMEALPHRPGPAERCQAVPEFPGELRDVKVSREDTEPASAEEPVPNGTFGTTESVGGARNRWTSRRFRP